MCRGCKEEDHVARAPALPNLVKPGVPINTPSLCRGGGAFAHELTYAGPKCRAHIGLKTPARGGQGIPSRDGGPASRHGARQHVVGGELGTHERAGTVGGKVARLQWMPFSLSVCPKDDHTPFCFHPEHSSATLTCWLMLAQKA